MYPSAMGAFALEPIEAGGRLSRMQMVVVGLILLLGAFLRFAAAGETVVDRPYRTDVAAYYQTAYNLNTYGVYSHDIHVVDGKEAAPAPDAFVTPGYPLLLSLFVDAPPRPQVFLAVALWQALMGTLTLLLVFWLFRGIGGFGVGSAAMLLTAMSPHLVDSVVFMITETWFTLLLCVSLVLFALHVGSQRRFLPCLLAAGLGFGIAALTRPVLEFFPPFLVALLFLTYPRREALRGSAVLLVGFLAVWIPWIVRNQVSVGKPGDSKVMIMSLTNGMYPDLEYDHDPRSLAVPYDYDPRSAEINASLGSALREIGRRFREDTGEELEWYLVGKPRTLWSWDVIEGGGDAYVYAVLRTPYNWNPVFRVTHALSFVLHWPLVVLALLASLYAWLPQARRRLQGAALVMARLAALLLFYNTALLMLLAPFVRYSIPFLPLIFGMAALGAALGIQWLKERRLRAAAA